MKILAVETATTWQSVAILDDNRVLAHESHQSAGAHSALLLPTIHRMLSGAGLRVQHMDGLACSSGPGSFTGIRVGVSTCLGLRDATGLPLALVPTLEAMAWNMKNITGLLCPVLISRKGEAYWAVFRWVNGRLERTVSETVGSPRALGRSLTTDTMLFGEGWSENEADIRAGVSPRITIVSSLGEAVRPSAVSVGELGLDRMRRGDLAGLHITPQYVQRTEAEIRYEQSGGLSPAARREERVIRKMGARSSRRSRYTDRTGNVRKSNR